MMHPHPLERRSANVAKTVAFLASDDAAFFTGEILHPSGGVFVG